MLPCSLSRKHKFSSHICDTKWGIKSQTSGRSYCPGLTTLLNLPPGQSKFYSLKAFKENICLCLYGYVSLSASSEIDTSICMFHFLQYGCVGFFSLQVLQEVEDLIKVKKKSIWF